MRVAPALVAPDSVDASRSDAALLAAFAKGETEALGELYDRHHLAMYRFLARLTSSRESDLDDLVQATFVEVVRSAARFDGRAQVRTWLFGIALNVARHHSRGRSRLRRILGDPGDDRPSEVPGLDRPDENVERRQLLERLDCAVATLPSPLREVFVACEIEGLQGTDVARWLGIPEGTLWRRLHDARKRIRLSMAGDAP
jgi:RNA polymerase sigma factor (sigma-70 family)